MTTHWRRIPPTRALIDHLLSGHVILLLLHGNEIHTHLVYVILYYMPGDYGQLYVKSMVAPYATPMGYGRSTLWYTDFTVQPFLKR